MEVDPSRSQSTLQKLIEIELTKRGAKDYGLGRLATDPKYQNQLALNQTFSEAGVKHGDLVYLEMTKAPSGNSGSDTYGPTSSVSSASSSSSCASSSSSSVFKGGDGEKKPRCMNHGPKGSCMSCMMLERVCVQREKERRTLEGVQLDNSAASAYQAYVLNTLLFSEQRVGILFGKVTARSTEEKEKGKEESVPSSPLGSEGEEERDKFVGPIEVHFIYEPAQSGREDSCSLTEGWENEFKVVVRIAFALGLSCVGLIVSHGAVLYNVSTAELQMLARVKEVQQAVMDDFNLKLDMPTKKPVKENQYQGRGRTIKGRKEVAPSNNNSVVLESGEETQGGSNMLDAIPFLLAVFAVNEDCQPGVEVFEITNRYFELVRAGVVNLDEVDKSDLHMMTHTKMTREIYVDRKYCKEIDNDYFVLPTAVSAFQSPLTCSFPIENRPDTVIESPGSLLSSYLRKASGIPLVYSLSDFHALLSLASQMDHEVAVDVAKHVKDGRSLPEGYELMITSMFLS